MSDLEYIKNIYNETACKYVKQNYIDYKYSPQRVRLDFCIDVIKSHTVNGGEKILDVGCGPGLMLAKLEQEGYKNLYGIDISSSMLEIAKTNVTDSVKLQIGNIADLPFKSDYFDFVVAAGILEYQNDDSSVNELFRILKPGGILIVNITNKLGYIHLFYPVRFALKSLPFIKKILNFVKKYIFLKGELSEIPKRRTHIPFYFDKLMATLFYQKIDFRYFHFSILPAPLNYFLGKYDDLIANKLEIILGKSKISFLISGGYIGVYKK